MEFQLGMKRLERILNTWDMNGATHQKSDSGKYEVNECRICGHIWRTRSDSVPTGIIKRTTVPSLIGFKPRFEALIAETMAFTSFLS